MNYTIEDINFKSSNNIHTIRGKIYVPNDKENIKGIIQIVHGMCEYFDRYIDFTQYLLQNNYIVCGHDHLGHGYSVNSKADYGYFADKLGYKCLIKDVWKMTALVKEKYPQYKYIVLGHSMGSFITRCYMYEYGNQVDGIILSGTIGPIKLINTIIKLTDGYIKLKGPRYKSKNIMKLAFRVSKINIKHSINKYDWVSRNVEVTKKYKKDKMGNFLFTASGYKDLFKLIQQANSIMNIKRIRRDLPIYFLSGDKDPLGENGKGVQKAYDTLRKYNSNVILKIYTNGRHEMLNEINCNKVYIDILNWIDEKVLQ